MISIGMTGTLRQGRNPYSASSTRVNTLARAAPPGYAWIAVRAIRMCSASGSSPIIFSAK